MTGSLRPHASHWGAYTAGDTAEGFRVVAAPGDPDPATLLANVPASFDERVRVRQPYVRRGWLERGPGPDDARGTDTYVPVGWDEALDLVAGELERVRREHGNEAIFGGSYGWGSAGRFNHAQSQVHRFLNTIGGYTRSAHTYSHGAAEVLLPRVVGSLEPLDAPTAWPVLERHTELFVCFGGLPVKNSQVGSGGVDRHHVGGTLRGARERGAEFVLVSPLRDDISADLGAQWIAPVPGTDTALMLALCHALLDEELYDAAFVMSHCEGFEKLRAYLAGEADGEPKTAEWAARWCGVDPATTRALARQMATHRTMITLSWSMQRSHHGEQVLWAGIALAAMLGQIGLPGGGFGHGYGCTANIGNARAAHGVPLLPQGSNDVDELIPVARIADALLHPGRAYDFDGQRRAYPDLRLVYWIGGNPFHHHQDLRRLSRAFGRPDTVVVHEPFWTATARHADIVLPATTTLEREDFGGSPVSGTLLAMHQVARPVGEARDDYAIFTALAQRLGVADDFTEGRTTREWLDHLYEAWRGVMAADDAPVEDFEAFWKAGRVSLPRRDHDHVMYADFRADPEHHPLPTPSGRIELYSGQIASFGYDDCPGHPTWLVPHTLAEPPGAGEYPLHLLANNPAARLHSQLDHGATSAASKIQDREPIRIHPRDARARELSAGDVVLVRSAYGSCLAGVVVSDAVHPGVVQLSTGAWFDPSAPDVATCIHGNPNALTPDLATSSLGQACAGQIVRVEVTRYDGELPPLVAYSTPVR